MPKQTKQVQEHIKKSDIENGFFKLKNILDFSKYIQVLLKRNVPPVPRTKLLRIFNTLKAEIELYDDARIQLAIKYSGNKLKTEKIPDDKGVLREVVNYDIPEGKLDAFQKELRELQESKVEISFTKIPVSDFDKCDENVGALLSGIVDFIVF